MKKNFLVLTCLAVFFINTSMIFASQSKTHVQNDNISSETNLTEMTTIKYKLASVWDVMSVVSQSLLQGAQSQQPVYTKTDNYNNVNTNNATSDYYANKARVQGCENRCENSRIMCRRAILNAPSFGNYDSSKYDRASQCDSTYSSCTMQCN